MGYVDRVRSRRPLTPVRPAALRRVTLVVALTLAVACGGEPDPEAQLGGPFEPPEATPETHALDGRPLFSPPLPPEVQQERERQLAEAWGAAANAPDDPEATIWVARRLGYLGRYREAIEILGPAIRRWPDDPRLYRHRGHRYITLRRFDDAVADLQRAAELIEGRPDEVEPDGLPNARNIPTSTLGSNVWYHLGLARYLQGDLEGAERAYRRGLEFSKNPDMLSATSHWLYMTLRRLGRDAAAVAVLEPVREDWDVIENQAYHSLLLLYKGLREPEDVVPADADASASDAALYGLAVWHRVEGHEQEGLALLRRIVEGKQWAAFGHIAAEADLAREGA